MEDRRRREGGFSLMELLVVVMIVGLLASIGVPVLVRALKKSSRQAVGTSMRDMHVAMTRYYTDNGFESLMTLDFERRLSTRHFFRTTTQGSWFEEENGFFYSQSATLFQWLFA